MNVQLKDITVTARDGRVSHLDQVYIRGSHVRFFIVPDMLRYVSLPNNDPSRPIPLPFRAFTNHFLAQKCAYVPKPWSQRTRRGFGKRTGYS